MFRSPQHDRRKDDFPLQRISLHRLDDSEIVPDARGTEPHIQIGEADPEQTHPRPKHVAAIQTTHASVGAITPWRFCELIAKSSDKMSQEVTPDCVAAQQINVDGQYKSTNADPE